MVTWEQLMKFSSLGGLAAQREQRPAQMLLQAENVWEHAALNDATILYLIPAEILPTLSFGSGLSAVIIKDGDTSRLPAELCNCMTLPTARLDAFRREIMSSFHRETEMRREIERLLSMTREEASLQDLAEELSQWLGRPVAVVDSSFRFVAKAMGETMESYFPQKDRDPEGLTEERLQMLMRSGILAESQKNRAPKYHQIEDFSIYSIPLYLKDTNVGLLGIPGRSGGVDRLPDEYSNELARLALPFEIAFAFRSKLMHKRRQNLAFMFSHLLEQEPEDTAHICERLRLFGYTLLHNMYLMCVRKRDGGRIDSQIMPDTLRNVFTNSFYLCNGEEMLFLISRPAGRGLSETELSIWDYQLGTMGLCAGLSGVFTDFRTFRRMQYREALLAQKVGLRRNETNICCFMEHQTEALLSDYADTELLSAFRYEPLLRLLEYDNEKGTELTATLREWLKNTKSPRAVCEHLYIHKNTLYKRLGKIEELMECDLTDPEVIMQIQMTFHILWELEHRNR